ncbi:TPA: hypothetical protein ACYLN4_000508 [Burkholderia lata]
MAKDDFIRVKYTREVEGRKKRTSVSIDPDLFAIFAKIRNSIPAARAVLRQWAIELDSERQWNEDVGVDGGIGLSRMVQRKMFAEIRTFVEKGIVVVAQEDSDGFDHPNAPRNGNRSGGKRAARPAANAAGGA